MNDKLVKKYIPEEFRNIEITTASSGMVNAISMFKRGGVGRNPNHKIHIEALRSRHQGYSSHPDIHQVILPSDDRLIVGYCRNRIIAKATIAHICAKTGLVTLLSSPHGSNYFNKSISELFSTWVRYDETRYPFTGNRIGDYAAFAGLQFRYDSNIEGITALNPRPDFRIKVDRKISRSVRKEMIANCDLLEGKGDMLRGVYGTAEPQWGASSSAVHKAAQDMGADNNLAALLSGYYTSMGEFKTPKAVLDTEGIKIFKGCHDGQVLKLKAKSPAESVYDICQGNPSHAFLSLILASERNSYNRNALYLAPIFIAARGGYSLKRIEK